MTERHIVEDDQGLDLEFEGVLLVDEQHHDVGLVKVFCTNSGKYVMTQNLSSRPGRLIKRKTTIFDSLEELGEELGFSRGAKVIRERLGLPCCRTV